MTKPGGGAELWVTHAQGDHTVHLVVCNGERTLCGRPLRPRPPVRSFRSSGCPRCLEVAVEAGHGYALDVANSWINLARMHSAWGAPRSSRPT